MSRSVVFDTPGLIDIRSFTSFGVNVKPKTDSPIGYFGTGLKNAIAILIRHGLNVELWIGENKKYTFYKSTSKFRDKDFDFIRMKRETFDWDVRNWIKPNYTELPYTTELGKDWKLWEAFRELYTNTIDEQGETYVRQTPDVSGQKERTVIQVTGESFVNEFFDKDRNFLPEGLRERQGTERLQVFERPCNYIYYRGMRVYDLEKPSTLTYNFLCEVKLSENRQAASPYMLQDEIAKYLLECENEEQIKKVLVGKDSYEAGLNYGYTYRSPSRAFTNAVRATPGAHHYAAAIVKSHEPRRHVTNPLEQWPRPWYVTVLGTGHEYLITDSNGEEIINFGLHDAMGTEQARYIAALLNKDLDETEFDQWIRDRPKDLVVTDTELEAEMREVEEQPPVFVDVDDDVPF